MKPKVSIIIPVYNGEKTVRRCLESVLSQSVREIEVLCINDGSTDGTASVLLETGSADRRVRLYGFEKNQGCVLAAKMGLLEASGDYVMFVDADDILLPGAIGNAVRLIEQYGVDVLQFGIKVTAPAGLDISGFLRNFQCSPTESSGIGILYDCFCFHRFTHNLVNKIYRREVCRAAAESVPDIEIKQFTDLYLSFFFLYNAKTFRSVTDGPYYEYSFGTGVSTHAPTASQFAELCACSAIVPAVEWFLKREDALDKNRFLVESIRTVLKSDVENKLMELPEITAETIRLVAEHWGSEVIYEFIKATGLLDLQSGNRYGMVTRLLETR